VLDSNGNVYVSDSGNHRVLGFPSLIFLPLAGATAMSVVGQPELAGNTPNWNSADGLATPQGLFSPIGLYMDRRDTLYVGDIGNNRVVHFLKPASVTHAANNQSGIPLARGSLAVFQGSGLADSEENAPGRPLPLALSGRELVVNDLLPAPVSSMSPAQINFQVPSNAPLGIARLAVRVVETGELIAGSPVALATSSPGLFTTSEDGRGQGRILNEDGTPNSASNAALKGSTIKIFGTGQGPVSPPVPDGEEAPAEPAVNTVAVPTSDGQACLSRQPSVCVAIGTTFGEIQFSGLASGEVGMWLITVKVPVNAPSGVVPLRALINGAPTNIVSVAIR
jgi:uncharacterized protein (TIGR03437 family)